MYSAFISTLAAWFVGLVLDANIDFGPQGVLCLRILFPLLTMGMFIIYNIRKNNDSEVKK